MRNGVVCASTIKMTDNCEIYKISCNIYFDKLHNRNSWPVLFIGTLISGLRDTFTLKKAKVHPCNRH